MLYLPVTSSLLMISGTVLLNLLEVSTLMIGTDWLTPLLITDSNAASSAILKLKAGPCVN